jgi:porin
MHLIDFSLNAGLNFNEPIWHRDDDVFVIGMGYTHVSSRAAGLDRDSRLFTNPVCPVRGGEAFVEATYRYQFKTWWQLQPTFQYVFNPGAGIINPNSATGKRVSGDGNRPRRPRSKRNHDELDRRQSTCIWPRCGDGGRLRGPEK